ncbi:VOC family protein [Salinibacillus xinjiangensis]|uniref:VOC domain-containing protein n=1 Tax=Salinibacillus xinjiangensis TaxID=1229268 RepID=A0A6G1XBJ0_9BACI|nr:VOC family protein [Salinibacillus xinjiangensis]MRG88307.1 hypothetical protein [Salinibacillus xinjiangensis]
MIKGRVVGFELSSQQPEKAVTFYSNVFGWEMGDPRWGYWPVHLKQGADSRLSGGIDKGPHDYPHGTRIQIEVDSIEQAISLAKEHGAQVVRDKMEFDDFYLAYLVDPVGLAFGLIEQK